MSRRREATSTPACIAFLLSLLASAVVLAEEPGAPDLAVINFAATQDQGGDDADGPAGSADAPPIGALTVLSPLAASTDDAWLSKAIADLIIQSLSEIHSLTVLERERMQIFSEEVGLADSALFSQEKALRVGRVARVEKVIFGNYRLSGARIALEVFLMDLESQEILRQERSTGRFRELRPLVTELVLRLLRAERIPVSDEERRHLEIETSDSIRATEHFYRAIDLHDRGAYAEALGEFAAASRQDESYLEARLWMGRTFENLGRHRHAYLAYEDVFTNAPSTVEGLDALFLAAKMLDADLRDPARAIELCKEITVRAPATPHAIEAFFLLGHLLESEGRTADAYEAFRSVDAFRPGSTRGPSTVGRERRSRFVTWSHALGLHRASIVKMIRLYGDLLQRGAEGPVDVGEDGRPDPPRGLFVLEADQPHFSVSGFDRHPAIFRDVSETPEWRERLYAVAVPKGYLATGVDFSITGQLLKQRPFHSFTMRILPFPLPRDFDQRWLGAIFGQTVRRTTLHKSVSFHGEDRRLFAVQLLESHSTIHGWEIAVRLRPEVEGRRLPAPLAVDDGDGFWEGMPAARIALPDVGDPGATRTTAEAYYRPKKELDVLYAPGEGHVLVTTVGDQHGRQTDLWISRSHDGTEWTPLRPLRLSSASDDDNPRLIRSELGKVWLSWISTRRGRGWELWLAQLDGGDVEVAPRRVPLDSFYDPPPPGQGTSDALLEYDLHQGRGGHWTVAFFSNRKRSIVLLRSSDLETWTVLAEIPLEETAFGLSLVEDSSGVHRLGYFGQKGKIHLWSSSDGQEWTRRRFDIRFWNQSFFPTPGSHRMRLFPLADSRLLMLVSDNQYGLQYSRFHADSGELRLDLVSRAGLEPYGVTRAPEDSILVALKETDRITLRRYRSFNLSGREIERDTRNWPIYMETETDQRGASWHRIFAQARSRVSDVTALGIDRAGRVWWGIESGIMYKEGEQFLATDVSLGFFHHFVTCITSTADGRVWFSSRYLEDPVLGQVLSPPPISSTLASGRPPRFETVRVPGLRGPITDTVRGRGPSEMYIGNSSGDVVGFDGEELFFEESFGSSITALSFDAATGDLWIGTESGGLYRHRPDATTRFSPSSGFPDGSVLDIEMDARGFPWVAVRGHGLLHLGPDASWKRHSPENSSVLYWNVGAIAADARSGIWYLPHDDERSRGLGYFDGTRGDAYNPPHRILERPSSIVVDEAGDVWIGTWFDGLYRFQRRKETS